MSELPKAYKPKEIEPSLHEEWEQNDIYRWNPNESRENSFIIDTPPPTVSGLLHMGHIFSYTQADFVARYQRMQGKNVFYPMGFDDNGLPTERLVEKVKKVRGGAMPRADFIKLCHEVVDEAEDAFRDLFKSVALSVDWKQEYQTISEQSRTISQLSFIDLFKKDKAFRQLQPTLWDPADRTALAQADVEDKEMPSQMSDITFTLKDGTPVSIATTRPELLPACVAVLCHPEDDRWKHHVGETVVTALCEAHVPLIADELVDMEKGTGLVMCCTFGDQTDVEWWRKHKLPANVILDHAGRISEKILEIECKKEVAEKLVGLKIKEARATMLSLLAENNLITKQEDISHVVKCAERSGHPLEILVTNQWFIKVIDQKEALLKKAAECNWHPHHMKIRIDQWIEGLSWDWCISRQRFFGVPFPIWYSKRPGEEGKILVAEPDQLPVDPLVDLPKGYTKDEVEAEKDVMDTWATSSVSPQLSSLAINDEYGIDTNRHKKLFPADLRPQAHEIIRTWAFYTIVKAHLHEDTIPWKNIMISGWCLAPDKTKMSKSKGNVITPVNLIEEKGADVVRYWASTSRLGADTAYSEDVLKIGKKLVNKIWNASKFAAIHLDKIDQKPTTPKQDLEAGIITETLDLWVISELQKTIEKATREFEKFEYCNARVAVEEFFWKIFCDNYLELVKTRSYNENGENDLGQKSAIYTIYHCLDTILRLFAPFVPHITETLYSHIFEDKYKQYGSIHAQGTWPDHTVYFFNDDAKKSGTFCVNILDAVRKLKATNNLSIKWPITSMIITPQNGNHDLWEILKPLISDLKNVTNAMDIRLEENPTSLPSEQTLETEDKLFTITVSFADTSDAA